MSDPVNKSLRRRGRLLHRATTVLLIGLLAVMVLDIVGALRTATPGAAVGFTLVFRLPLLIYLWALWTVRRAFEEIAQGIAFGRVVPQVLRRVGAALAAGAVASVLVTPLLLHSLFPSRWTAFGSFDPAAITLGVVGVLLTLLARLLDQATVISDELDGIF